MEEEQLTKDKKDENLIDVDAFFQCSINNDLTTGSYRQTFVTELLSVLTEKLEAFWKLSQSYTNENEEILQEKIKNFDVIFKYLFVLCN